MVGCPHSRLECECVAPKEEPERKTLLEEIHDFAEIANTAADLLVGHRAILISGGIDATVVDQMVYNLHCKILGTGDHDPFQFDDMIEDDE